MSSILLSIVTVTKNCESSICKTLSSISLIKNSSIEYIVIDGASIDGTVDRMKSFSPIINKFVSEVDTGIYNAMNKGINLASGKYTLFINGDDQVLPDGFSEILHLLERGSADIYCAKTLIPGKDGDGEVFAMNQWCLPFFNSIPHPSAFFCTDVLKKYLFREDLKIASDYDLFLRLFISGKVFKKIDIVSALHYRGGASGDVIKSSAEVNQIRKERLGLFFYVTEAAMYANRLLKKIRLSL